MIRITIPGLRLVSEANARDHWAVKARRVQRQRDLARMLTARPLWARKAWPLRVTITRIAPRSLDSDNLVGSAKAVRDGIADALGVDDKDPRVEWRVEQRKGRPGEYAVEVRVERVERQSQHESKRCG